MYQPPTVFFIRCKLTTMNKIDTINTANIGIYIYWYGFKAHEKYPTSVQGKAFIRHYCKADIGRCFTVQTDNEPKHNVKATQEFLKTNKWNNLHLTIQMGAVKVRHFAEPHSGS